MKKLVLLILAASAAMPLAASAADASVYADVLSAYVYRGVVGNDEAVFQPGLDVAGPFGLGYSLWASMNLTDADSPWYPDTFGKWGEVDMGLNWSAPLEGPVGLTVGATYFLYPQDGSEVLVDDETGEPLVDADGNVQVSKAPPTMATSSTSNSPPRTCRWLLPSSSATTWRTATTGSSSSASATRSN